MPVPSLFKERRVNDPPYALRSKSRRRKGQALNQLVDIDETICWPEFLAQNPVPMPT